MQRGKAYFKHSSNTTNNSRGERGNCSGARGGSEVRCGGGDTVPAPQHALAIAPRDRRTGSGWQADAPTTRPTPGAIQGPRQPVADAVAEARRVKKNASQPKPRPGTRAAACARMRA